MKILGIESSCDETAAAVIEASPSDKTVKLLSNILTASLRLHAKTGGIIPEQAAREQIKHILPIIDRTLQETKVTMLDIDAIAVTYGPGLIGSLLVGVETAKTLATIYKKPLIPINHLLGHIYANFITSNNPSNIEFPLVGLVVSGGHTDLLLMKKHGDITWLGGTRDDAAGEALDKIGRLLGFSYPGGPQIEKIAKTGKNTYLLPRPLKGSDDFDFSFSGLKTAALRQVQKAKKENRFTDEFCSDIAKATQDAVIDVLITKTIKATKKYNAKSILLGGGVSANNTLKQEFVKRVTKENTNASVIFPEKNLSTDNGAMIASAAFFIGKPAAIESITADPELYFD